MKNMVFGLIAGGMVILFAVLLLTLLHKNVRREELQQSLAEAMEGTMRAWVDEQEKRMEAIDTESDKGLCSKEAFTDYFLQALSVQLSSDSTVSVKVLAADAKKGLLSVEATEEFTYPGGQKGSVTAERTIIADRKEVVKEEVHTVRFFRSKEDMENGENVYKQFQIQHGDKLIQPGEPKKEKGSGTFLEWRDRNDYLSDFSQTVEGDLTYYAVFE